jgi:hypothetical protein
MTQFNLKKVRISYVSESTKDPFGFQSMSGVERAQTLSSIFNRLLEIDADSAPARASSILAGLGFLPEMQTMPTKVICVRGSVEVLRVFLVVGE